MSDRSFGNHPYNVEQFSNRKGKGKRKRNKKGGHNRNHRSRPRLGEIKDRVSQDIVEMTKRRGGHIYAHNIKNAVDILSRWLKKHSKRLIDAAFRNLVGNKVYRFDESELGFRLMAAA